MINLSVTKNYYLVSSGYIESKLNLSSGQTSDKYTLPTNDIDGISIMFTGTPSIYFTNYSVEDIQNETALYELWDGTSEISNLVTGFYVVNSGVSCEIMIRILVAKNV